MRVLLAAAAYFIGSIPTGYLFVRAKAGRDIRQVGSRSTGATNVLRLGGWKYAIPVAAIDIFKGFAPAFGIYKITGDIAFASFCAFLSVLGHCFPVFLGFKGGKGVATSLGAYAALALQPLLFSLSLFTLVVVATRFVSLGSILASLTFPFWVLLFGGKQGVFAWSLALSVLVILNHRENIRRLFQGRESRLGEKIR